MLGMPPIGMMRKKSRGWASFVSAGIGHTVSGGGADLSIVKPVGAVSGDLLVLFMLGHGGASPSVIPSGFTMQSGGNFSVESSSLQVRSALKIAGGSEPASYTWTWSSGSSDRMGVVLAYRPIHATQPSTSGINSDLDGNSSLVQNDLTTLNPNDLLVYAWCVNLVGGGGGGGGSINSPPAGMTNRYSRTTMPGRNDLCLFVYDELRPTPGAVGTRTLVLSHSANGAGLRVAVRAP